MGAWLEFEDLFALAAAKRKAAKARCAIGIPDVVGSSADGCVLPEEDRHQEDHLHDHGIDDVLLGGDCGDEEQAIASADCGLEVPETAREELGEEQRREV